MPSSLRIRSISSTTSGSSRLMIRGPGSIHGDLAAKPAVGLRYFESDIAAAENDEMRRQIVEFEGFDVRQRARGREAGDIRDCGVRPDIEENPIAGQQPRAAVIELHLKRLRRDEAPARHDQF